MHPFAVVLAIVLLGLALGSIEVTGWGCGYNPSDVAKLQVSQLVQAIELFHFDTGRFPSDREGLAVLIDGEAVPNWYGPYIDRREAPIDPWGRPYLYKSTAESFELWSFGEDGKPGGEGENEDIDESCSPPQGLRCRKFTLTLASLAFGLWSELKQSLF